MRTGGIFVVAGLGIAGRSNRNARNLCLRGVDSCPKTGLAAEGGLFGFCSIATARKILERSRGFPG